MDVENNFKRYNYIFICILIIDCYIFWGNFIDLFKIIRYKIGFVFKVCFLYNFEVYWIWRMVIFIIGIL